MEELNNTLGSIDLFCEEEEEERSSRDVFRNKIL